MVQAMISPEENDLANMTPPKNLPLIASQVLGTGAQAMEIYKLTHKERMTVYELMAIHLFKIIKENEHEDR